MRQLINSTVSQLDAPSKVSRSLCALLFAVSLGLLSLSSKAEAVSVVNSVRAVSVAETGATTEVRIRGDREPTYTVFKLTEPTRVVVDLTSTDVSAVDRLQEIEGVAVKAVMTTQFDDAESKVGRVMIVLARGADYDVRTEGNDVVIAIGTKDSLSATQGDASQTEASSLSLSSTSEINDSAAPNGASAPPSTELATASTAQSAEPEAQPSASPNRDELKPGVRAGHALIAVRTGVRQETTTIALDTDAPPRIIEWQTLENPARLAVDLVGISSVPKHIRDRALRRSSEVKRIRLGQHEDRVRVVIDGRGAEIGQVQIDRTAKGVAIRLRPSSTSSALLATATDSSAPSENKGSVAKISFAEGGASKEQSGKAEVRALTYARSGDTGRVVVGIRDAGKVHYRVTQPDPRTAVLTLRGTSLEESLEQTFDASSFGGAVKAVTAFRDPSEKDLVKVVATLAKPVRSKIVPMRGGLAWEFDFNQAGVVAEADQNTNGILGPSSQVAGLSSEGAEAVVSSGERARGFHGRRINLEFKEIDIHNVLRMIAEVSKRNIVVSDDVKGKITLQLRNVPWDQALDLILRSSGAWREQHGNIIRIALAETLAKEKEQQVKTAEANRALEQLKVRLVGVNFAKASDMSSRVKEILTTRGTVTVDDRTNFLIIKDTPSALAKAEQLVQRLDSETPQVLIESRIVEANVSFTREIGVQWGGNVSMSPALGNATGLVFPNVFSVAGGAGDTPNQGTSGTPSYAVNMPAPAGINTGGSLGFIFGSAGGAANLNLRLSAMENDGVIKTISAPKVTTLDNQKASISQGLSIPFSQISASGTNTTFIEAKLQLDVTPHVTSNGSILMDVQVANNQPNPQLTGSNGQPSISKKEAKTTVMVKDGDTTVIGGIYTRVNSEANNRVPGLSRIPILGWFFRKKNITDSRTELLVFITPRIINRSEATVGAL